MPTLTLIPEAKPPEQYFPAEVRDIVGFCRKHPEIRPVVLDFLKRAITTDDTEHRVATLDEISKQYGVAGDPALEKLAFLLTSLYSIKSKNHDPRALVVEYIAYQRLLLTYGSGSEIQCALRWRDGGHTTRVISSRCNFDAAALTRREFVGYECKVTLKHFLAPDSSGKNLRGRNKLQFMLDSHNWIQSQGRASKVALVTLQAAESMFLHRLISHGFPSVEILGAKQVERMLR